MKTVTLHSIVLMVGPSGSGKSTLAAELFAPHEIISSDGIRAQLTGDFRNQSRNDEIFVELHRRTKLMIGMGQRVVVDATNLKARDRKFFVDLSKSMSVPLFYIVVNRPVEDKLASGGWRLEVNGLIQKHDEDFRSNLKDIMNGDGHATVIDHKEGFRIIRRKEIKDAIKDGGFTRLMVIGDIHGNHADAKKFADEADSINAFTVYLGDVIDYGDNNLDAFWLVYGRIMAGKALMVWGNHERKLDTWIRTDFGTGYRGKIGHGMQKTLDEIESLSNTDAFRAAWNAMESMAFQHYIVDDMLFTHAAATAGLWNINNHRPYGEHGQLAYFGEVDKVVPFREDGYPNRVYDWINHVPAGRTVIVGHDIRSTDAPMIVNNPNGSKVIFLDTGSGKGGKLSQMTYDL